MRIRREFYERDTLTVARALIGQFIVRKTPAGIVKGRIVETEAYLGEKDDAAHSYKGRTDRVRVQYGAKGCAYIYLIYGMYHCMNITSGPADTPEVVLIRALEPVDGIDVMVNRRKTDKLKNLCSGPGKLCMALDISMAQYGTDLCTDENFYLEYGTEPATDAIAATARINIDYATTCRDKLWRFVWKDSPFLSRKKL
jgi:DNA-3-methyladenine glycosylase